MHHIHVRIKYYGSKLLKYVRVYQNTRTIVRGMDIYSYVTLLQYIISFSKILVFLFYLLKISIDF